MFEPACYETVCGDGTELIVCNDGGGFQAAAIVAAIGFALALVLVFYRMGVIANAVTWLWSHAKGEVDIKEVNRGRKQ